jgi:signal transduction histidine kinase
MPEPNAPRVLALDPDRRVLEAIADGLKGQGCEVTLATSADEGRRLLQSATFCCVLIDHDLERESNGGLRSELERYPAQTVALILMGSPSQVSVAQALGSGAYDYLPKPVETDLLRLTVARAVERASLARTMRELLEELDLANADLQQRVERATSDLQQAHRQREEFIHVIAHELGAPLTAVRGYAEMLGDPTVPPAVHRRARAVIIAETRRMARLVQDLTQGPQFELDVGACDLAAVVREQVELVRAQAGERLELRLPDRPVPLLADRDRLAQVVANLLSNALKYAPNGPIRVGLAVEGDHVQLDVVDQGPGIPPDRREAIFDARVRLVTAASADQPSGAGLGLHVVRQIVERHGGRVWADSVGTAGARFSVWLPLRTPVLERVQAPRARAGSRTRAR